jgi:hypothetical protein
MQVPGARLGEGSRFGSISRVQAGTHPAPGHGARAGRIRNGNRPARALSGQAVAVAPEPPSVTRSGPRPRRWPPARAIAGLRNHDHPGVLKRALDQTPSERVPSGDDDAERPLRWQLTRGHYDRFLAACGPPIGGNRSIGLHGTSLLGPPTDAAQGREGRSFEHLRRRITLSAQAAAPEVLSRQRQGRGSLSDGTVAPHLRDTTRGCARPRGAGRGRRSSPRRHR